MASVLDFHLEEEDPSTALRITREHNHFYMFTYA